MPSIFHEVHGKYDWAFDVILVGIKIGVANILIGCPERTQTVACYISWQPILLTGELSAKSQFGTSQHVELLREFVDVILSLFEKAYSFGEYLGSQGKQNYECNLK